MAKTAPAAPAEVLAAELSAALPARKTALEFERRFAAPDQNERINRGLFEIRIAESRLKPFSVNADKVPEPGSIPAASTLATLAVSEAEDLEAEAHVLEPLVGPGAAGRQVGLLRLVCALLRLARLGEGRARACFTYARQRKRLPGFDDALELAPENELFYLALRRFEALLQAGGAWSAPDADWLRLRAVTAPGRLRLRAAALRSCAEAAANWALPPALDALRKPFIDFGYETSSALAWAVAGFSPKEALAWGDAGLAQADQAQAWRDRGMTVEEAAAWANADLLPDEAAAFKACGATDPHTARDLRHVIGDVENLLVWHRAGFEMAEVLRLRAKGVNNVADALHQREQDQARQAPAILREVQAPPRVLTPAPTAELPALPALKEPVPEVYEAPPSIAADDDSEPLDDWAQERAQRLFGLETHDPAEALAIVPEKGGAWMAWGRFETQAPGPAATAYALTAPLAGSWMDLISESEIVALPGASQAPKRLEPRDLWQDRLDRLRAVQGRLTVPGQWYLHAWAPSRAWLFWGLVFKRVPWGQSLDFDSHENWLQRWARKADEWGEKGAPCPCAVGRAQDGSWWIAILPSINASGEGPTPIQPAMMVPAWRKAMSDFCLKMGMGAHAAQWHLLAGTPAEPERQPPVQVKG